MTDLAAHWDSAYRRGEDACSWHQREAAVSLRLLDIAGPAAGSTVIDVGGGTSRLTDALLDRGDLDLTVLDVAPAAVELSRRRLGAQAQRVRWIVEDVTAWEPTQRYDVWHDRAVFHFLTAPADREAYRGALRRGTRPGSVAVLAAFAPDGPDRCSGLPAARYDAGGLAAALGPGWTLLHAEREEHHTPAGAIQPFTWALLRRE